MVGILEVNRAGMFMNKKQSILSQEAGEVLRRGNVLTAEILDAIRSSGNDRIRGYAADPLRSAQTLPRQSIDAESLQLMAELLESAPPIMAGPDGEVA